MSRSDKRPRRAAVMAAVVLAGAATVAVFLEGPAGAGAFSVSTVADTPDATPGDGVCADAGGSCSLRAAITEANATPGADTITLPSGTFTVGLAGADDTNAGGDFDVAPTDGAAITITGAGAGSTFVDGAGVDRVFDLRTGTLTLDGVNVRNGSASPGGGVRVAAGATLSVTRSELSANASGDGSAIRSDGTTSLVRSAVTGNGGGSAAIVVGGGTFTATNSTIGANGGAGLRAAGGSSTLIHVTVAGNGGSGVVVAGGSVSLRNSIVAGNAGEECSPAGVVSSQGFNVSDDGSCSPNGATDRPGTDPLLNALTDNGGPTRTFLPRSGSPAIDLVAGACPVDTDQRGTARPTDGNADGSPACDAGAVEVSATPPNAGQTPTTAPAGGRPATPGTRQGVTAG